MDTARTRATRQLQKKPVISKNRTAKKKCTRPDI